MCSELKFENKSEYLNKICDNTWNLGDFGTNSCVILLVCWHQILSDDFYFDDFDSKAGHGINGTAQCPTGTRTQELSHTMRALEPDDRPVTISLCLNRFVPESARNLAGTNNTRLSLCCSQSEQGPTLSHQMSRRRGEAQGPTGFGPRTSHIPCEHSLHFITEKSYCLFVFVEVLRPSQPNGVMSSAVSLPNHMFTGQA